MNTRNMTIFYILGHEFMYYLFSCIIVYKFPFEISNTTIVVDLIHQTKLKDIVYTSKVTTCVNSLQKMTL